MPIERRSSGAQVRSIVIAVVSVLLVGTLGYAVIRAATDRDTAVTRGAAGGGKWNAGSAASKAKLVAEGGPILIPDPGGAQRLPIYISHTGSSAKKGWYAFEARPAGAPSDCFIEWDRKKREFVAPCDQSTYPVDGTGLRSFDTTVTRDGDLIIDLTTD
jgi:hypothetical protein